MNRKVLISFAACLLVFILNAAERPAATPQTSLSETVNIEKGELQWLYKGRPLLVYVFATNQFKPYVRDLYTLRGENMLRDAPKDHLHHHGLMYAIRMNGVNFWEETGAPGIEKSVRLVSHKVGKGQGGLPEASFTQLIHWLAFTNRHVADSAAAAFLIENRTLTLTVDEKNEEIALRWDAAFEVGKSVPRLEEFGSQYNGLGMRLPQSLDKTVQFQNSENAPYTGADSRNLIPAKWTTVSGPVDGKDVMLALFGHPKNDRGDGNFYSLRAPVFAYLSVTQELDKEPLIYTTGQKYRLRYLLTVYTAGKSREFIEKRAEAWRKD
jgi:hypothetical protein